MARIVSGYVQTIYGRRRSLPELNSRDRVARQAAERVTRNTSIQGSAADIIKLAMIGVDRTMTEQKRRSRMCSLNWYSRSHPKRSR